MHNVRRLTALCLLLLITQSYAAITGTVTGGRITGTNVINVKGYGAVGDGVTDDTPSIQSAIDSLHVANIEGGIIFLPRGAYKITNTLNLYQTGFITRLSLIGEALDAVEIRWAGATDGVAVKVGRNRGMRLNQFTLKNTVAADTTIGIQFTGDVGGTNNASGSMEQVRIQSFHQCLVVGDTSSHAASEIHYYGVNLNSCDVGVIINDSQTVNHWFYGLGFASNTIGMTIGSGSPASIFVQGASMSSNGQDFAFSTGNNIVLDNIRSENAGRFLTYGSDSGADGPTASNVTVRNCVVNNTTEIGRAHV